MVFNKGFIVIKKEEVHCNLQRGVSVWFATRAFMWSNEGFNVVRNREDPRGLPLSGVVVES